MNNLEEMVQAIKKIDTIDRLVTRKRAETFFSVEKMISGYQKVYKKIINEYRNKKSS